jgi:hemolysin III
MKKRTKLCDRLLPAYSVGEERMNMITHIVGAGLGLVMLLMCVIKASYSRNIWGIVASVVYGISLIALYTVSSVYHGMKLGLAKKVMQVIDHCTIYFLIAGSYTVVVLSALRPAYPHIAWGLFGFVWALTVLAVVLTAIDLKKYNVFSMACYVGMGWCVIPFWRQTQQVLTWPGFWLLLSGGIAYTIGAVLYGAGKKKKWMHSVFHIFVVIGSILQFLSVWIYAI